MELMERYLPRFQSAEEHSRRAKLVLHFTAEPEAGGTR